MDVFVIKGSKPLRGKVRISGSKNAVLPIMAATLLTSDISEIDNVPNLRDVHTMTKLLTRLGASIDFSKNRLTIDTRRVRTFEAPYELVRTMRASVLVMGPLLARFRKARVSLPGGCAIGARPIDIHLKGFAALGADIKLDGGYVDIRGRHSPKRSVRLPFPSVGATENLMMYAAALPHKTVLRNAAREPEITDLANFLASAGASVRGAGSDTIEIVGSRKLKGSRHSVIPDRIEAGTFAVAAAMTLGDLALTHARADHLESVLDKLEEAGARVDRNADEIRVSANRRTRPITLTTMPYPGFPTDMQAQFMAMMAVGDGTGVITETVFENRFLHAAELTRMGADISLEGRVAVVKGVRRLKGAPVTASDLRASAALVLAGLVAEGKSEVRRVYHIDRGYESMEVKLRSVGADIIRKAE